MRFIVFRVHPTRKSHTGEGYLKQDFVLQFPKSDIVAVQSAFSMFPGSGCGLTGSRAVSVRIVLLVAPGKTTSDSFQPAVIAPRIAKPTRRHVLFETLLALKANRTTTSATSPGQRLSPITTVDSAKHLRILLAEDHPVNQKLAVLVLQRLGNQPDVVGNGLEAVEAVQRQRYDLVLMDVQMPELDGLEATRRIRATLPKSEQPQIIALTAGVAQFDEKACRAAGMDGFLAKPFKPEQLAAVLESTVAALAGKT
jgi:CheY-like chemotaxis protein